MNCGYGERATKLCALKLGQVLVCAEQTLHGLDVLLLSESRKVIQVVESLIQHPTEKDDLAVSHPS